MTSNALIKIDGLSKRYGRAEVFALKDLSISVSAGEVYGFLGPNGAGKSTTIRTLMNFIQPTAGSATIAGHDSVADSVDVKRVVGYLASDMAMYDKMTGKQFLNYMDQLQGGSNRAYRQELSKRLKAQLDKKLGELSRGNKQKIALIQALMHRPEVLIMDEPSSGLDPLMQETYYDLLKEARQRGAAVFMSGHNLAEVQKVCDRVGIIRNGKLIVERNIAEMANQAAHTLDITFADKPPLTELRSIKGVKVTGHAGTQAQLHVKGEMSALLSMLSKYHVTNLEVHQLDLEELFLHFYSEVAK